MKLKDWSISLPAAVKAVCYNAPHFFFLTDTIQIIDEYSGRLVETLQSTSSFQMICDGDLTASSLKQELYGIMVGCTLEGELVIIDYIDSDDYVNTLLDQNQVLPAFSILHRNEKIHNTLIDQIECHQKAFLYFFTLLNWSEAFTHAASAHIHPNEFLQLFPDLVNQSIPAATFLTKDIIGKNTRTMADFVISLLKQQSSNPSAITATSEEVIERLESSRQQLLSYLLTWHSQYPLEVSIDTAILHLLLQYQPTQVYSFLSSPTACQEEDVQPLLTEKGMFSALAQFYIQKQQPRKALEIWKQLALCLFI